MSDNQGKAEQDARDGHGLMRLVLTAENIIGQLLSNKEKWHSAHRMIKEILVNKEREERLRQAGR